jgi:hypothetical protein
LLPGSRKIALSSVPVGSGTTTCWDCRMLVPAGLLFVTRQVSVRP